MRTAQEMADYVIKRNLAFATDKMASKGMIPKFQMIQRVLSTDEDVLMAFLPLDIYDGPRFLMGPYPAIAFTNRRIICSQKYLFNEDVKILNLDTVNDIHSDCGVGTGKVWIDTIRERLGFTLKVEQIDRIFPEIINYLDNYKNAKVGTRQCVNAVQANVVSAADEIRKYKDLLDMGIITQEEFNTKKKQLLGL